MQQCNSSESESRSVVSDSLQPHGPYSPWNSPGQNTGVGSLSLLQGIVPGIVPTQGSNPGLLHCRCILYQLSHKGSPRKLEWVVYPFSRGSSWPRNWTRVSCIAGRFFTNWVIGEALAFCLKTQKINSGRLLFPDIWTLTYIWTCEEYELSTTNWHLPSTFTRLNHALLQLLIFNTPEGVQGGEQKWPTRCSGKNCQNRSSESY